MAETQARTTPRAARISATGKSNNQGIRSLSAPTTPQLPSPYRKVTNKPRHFSRWGRITRAILSPSARTTPGTPSRFPQPALEERWPTPCRCCLPWPSQPLFRGGTGDDYAKDRRRKKRKRILLGVLAFVLRGVRATGAAWAYISGIEQEMNEDITPEVVEALEAPAEYDGGTFYYAACMGTDKSAAREQSTQYAGDTFRSDS